MSLSLLLVFPENQILDLLILLFFYSLMSTFVYVIVLCYFPLLFLRFLSGMLSIIILAFMLSQNHLML